MLSHQQTDPGAPERPKPFILFRPWLAVWHFLVPPTLADRDRQSPLARWLARILAAVIGVGIIVLAFVYAKPMQDRYQNWRADSLVDEAESLANDGRFHEAFQRAQKAVGVSPENVRAIRMNADYLTRMRQPQALYFLNRLDQEGATTPADRQLRVRALMNLQQPKEASLLLEEILQDSTPDDNLMKLASDVWGRGSKDGMILRALKNYAAKHPEDRRHSLRLAKAQADTSNPDEVNAAVTRALELAAGDDDTSLAALEFLDTFPELPADPSNQLIQRMRSHPKAQGLHKVAALRRELKLNPAARQRLIQEAMAEARGRTRDDLVPFVRWLIEPPLQEFALVLSMVTETEAKTYQPLLENYLTALTLMKRFEDLERLVNDPQVNRLINRNVAAFYRAHLAYVTNKSPEETRSALITAKSSADVDHRGDLLVKIAEYAEARGHDDIAEEAFRSASLIPQTETTGYQGLLRATAANGNTEGLLAASRAAVRRWPDNPTYMEQLIYANLLVGCDIELAAPQVQKLLELKPGDDQRRLLMAFSLWRLKDFTAAAENLQKMDLRNLTPGQRAVFAAIARDSGLQNAREAAMSVIQEIPPQARMLPEERDCFAHAGR